eukprot:517435-Pleurochrysis_carterae.AAC.3
MALVPGRQGAEASVYFARISRPGPRRTRPSPFACFLESCVLVFSAGSAVAFSAGKRICGYFFTYSYRKRDRDKYTHTNSRAGARYTALFRLSSAGTELFLLKNAWG